MQRRASRKEAEPEAPESASGERRNEEPEVRREAASGPIPAWVLAGGGTSAAAGAQGEELRRATDGRISRAPHLLLHLQRRHGNRYVQRVLAVAREGGPAEVPGDVEAAIQRSRGAGRPLDGSARGQLEPAFGVDFGGVRVHTGAEADRLNRDLEARAFTTGSDIFFRNGEYSPGNPSGRELLAHELTHVVQQGGQAPSGPLTVGAVDDPAEREADQTAAAVMRQTEGGRGPAAATETGAAVRRETEAPSAPAEAPPAPAAGAEPAPVPAPTREDGSPAPTLVEAEEGEGAAPPVAAEAEPSPVAPKRLPGAPSLSRRPYPGVQREPPAGAGKAAPATAATAYGPFRIKIPGKVPAGEVAILTFMQVFSLDRKTASAWAARSRWESFELTPDEIAAGVDEVYIGASFFGKVQAAVRGGAPPSGGPGKPNPATVAAGKLAKLSPEEQKSAREEADKEFEKRTQRKPPGKGGSQSDRELWGEIANGIVADREAIARYKALPPEIQQLITGDGPPSTDYPRLLRIAEKLAKLAPEQRSFYCKMARKLAKDLDEFEGAVDDFVGGKTPGPGAGAGAGAKDDKELHGGTVLASFVRSVGTGLALVALGGIIVGAEILTAGQVTWLFVGLGAAGGFSAYLSRRDEIEASGYDVPRLNTAIHAVGDIFGVSGVIEGASGHRLGTNVELSGEVRSEELGAGLGSIATVLFGSRAFNQGRAFGRGVLEGYRGPQVPGGPNANVNVNVSTATPPAKPQPNPNPGPLEAAKRAALSPDLQTGFDAWSEGIRAKGKSPEDPLGRMNDSQLRSAVEKEQARYNRGVEEGKQGEYERTRAKDDPLRPQLYEETRGNIKIRYYRPGEGGAPGKPAEIPPGGRHPNAPSEVEIAHGQEVARRTGEPVTVFGKTASGIDYPGIDGTIGEPPRPLQLKSYAPDANAGSARFAAQEALAKAKAQGYSQVQVEISMPGKTAAEVQAAWDAGPRPGTGDHPLGPYYEGSVIAKIIIRCKGGEVWSPPRPEPTTTGVLPQQPRRDEDKEKEKEKEKK